MDESELRAMFTSGRVAHLATVDGAGTPHVVPIVFAVDGNTIFFAIDQKPKRTRDLKRLRNITDHPAVSVLVDHYDDDWSALWWVRADGTARVLTPGPETDRAIALLTQRYTQYQGQLPPGPAVAIEVERWSAWSAR